MASKITMIRRSGEVTRRFTCRYCGAHECAALPGEGRVAGRAEKKIICLKCNKVVDGD